MSVTRLQLRQRLGEQETGLATLGTATSNGTTTTVIDATRFLGPWSASRWPRGTAIRFSTITGGTVTATTDTYLDSYAPATGTLTLSPPIAAPVTSDTFEVWSAVDSVSLVDKAIDRGLTRHCFRWVPIPLTKVVDGDMGDPLPTLWTASAAGITPSKVNMAATAPDKFARRYLRTLHTIASKYVYSNTIDCVPGDTWRLSALSKANVGTAILSAYDVTNSTAITLVGDGGSYAGRAWAHLDNTFVIPATCKQWRVHVGGTGATDDIYWTSVIAYEQNETQFALPVRIASRNKVGEVQYRTGDDVEDFVFEPYCVNGRHALITEGMPATMVYLSVPPGTGWPAYVEELCTYDALATDAATTDCDEELALKSIAYELYKDLANRGYALPTPQGYLAPSEWRLRRDEKLGGMQRCQLTVGAQSKAVWR